MCSCATPASTSRRETPLERRVDSGPARSAALFPPALSAFGELGAAADAVVFHGLGFCRQLHQQGQRVELRRVFLSGRRADAPALRGDFFHHYPHRRPQRWLFARRAGSPSAAPEYSAWQAGRRHAHRPVAGACIFAAGAGSRHWLGCGDDLGALGPLRADRHGLYGFGLHGRVEVGFSGWLPRGDERRAHPLVVSFRRALPD